MPGFSGKSTILKRLDENDAPMELDSGSGFKPAVFPNEFGLTVPVKRFDAAKRTGRLELDGKEERYMLLISETRGPVEEVALFALNRTPFRAKLVEVKKLGESVEVRFERE